MNPVAAISLTGPVSPGSDMAVFSKIPVENGGQESGHADLTDA
jgi:hypothetical protein